MTQSKSSATVLTVLALVGLFVACQAEAPAAVPGPSPASDTAVIPPSPSETPTTTSIETPTASLNPTPSITPTFAVLRGKVIPEKLSCRFGPGAAYLYKYGLFATTVVEIIGRMELSDWVLVQAIGGNNPCWVRGDFLEINGDPLAVEPVDPHIVLAWSPYYRGLTNVTATREEDTVTVRWNLLALRAGDDSQQIPYVVEAWVCVDGKFSFRASGWYEDIARIMDEAGCSEESYARIAGAEKHGYTPWVDFPWPIDDRRH